MRASAHSTRTTVCVIAMLLLSLAVLASFLARTANKARPEPSPVRQSSAASAEAAVAQVTATTATPHPDTSNTSSGLPRSEPALQTTPSPTSSARTTTAAEDTSPLDTLEDLLDAAEAAGLSPQELAHLAGSAELQAAIRAHLDDPPPTHVAEVPAYPTKTIRAAGDPLRVQYTFLQSCKRIYFCTPRPDNVNSPPRVLFIVHHNGQTVYGKKHLLNPQASWNYIWYERHEWHTGIYTAYIYALEDGTPLFAATEFEIVRAHELWPNIVDVQAVVARDNTTQEQLNTVVVAQTQTPQKVTVHFLDQYHAEVLAPRTLHMGGGKRPYYLKIPLDGMRPATVQIQHRNGITLHRTPIRYPGKADDS